MAKRSFPRRARQVVHGPVLQWYIQKTSGLVGGYSDEYMTTHVCCGKRRQDKTGSYLRFSRDQADVTCTECKRRAELSLEDYRAERKAEQGKLEALRAEQTKKQREAREALIKDSLAAIDEVRPDALVMLDAVLQDTEYPRAEEVLRAALVLHRINNPRSRGERLWVFRGGDPNPSTQEICCRFCGGVMGSGRVGYDYTQSWFTADRREHATEHWAQQHVVEEGLDGWPDVNARLVVGVNRHTTLCALAYLSDTKCLEPVPW